MTYWPTETWQQWSLSVESASNGVWIPDARIGTLKHMDPTGEVLGYAHLAFNGTHVITPWGTKSGNDAKTVLTGGDILRSAQRWVDGPGTVKMNSALAAQAKKAATIVSKAYLTDRAEALVAHLVGVGITAMLWKDGVTEYQSEVRVYGNDSNGGGSLIVRLYANGSVNVADASGSARGLEVLAAAVDDWETLAAPTAASLTASS